MEPIQFWLTDVAVKNLPTIFPAVRVLLSIPGSNARIESSFSQAGIVKTRLRNRMAAERLQDLLFVRLNLPKLYSNESEFVLEVGKRYTPRMPFSSSGHRSESRQVDSDTYTSSNALKTTKSLSLKSPDNPPDYPDSIRSQFMIIISNTVKDMQAEWGTQLGWTGSPSCSWIGVHCNSEGNVVDLYVLFQVREATKLTLSTQTSQFCT